MKIIRVGIRNLSPIISSLFRISQLNHDKEKLKNALQFDGQSSLRDVSGFPLLNEGGGDFPSKVPDFNRRLLD